MKKFFFWTALLLLFSNANFAQVSINTDNGIPDPSAMLDVKSSNRGFLPPRMTHTEINAIISPANGLIVYCTDCGTNGNGAFFGYINGMWNCLFTCLPPSSPSTGVHVPSTNQIIWSWNTVSGATGYKWNTTNNYSAATDMGTTTSKTETGLICNTPYTRYIWAYNSCGISVFTSLSQTTLMDPPASPTAGTHVPSQNQIVWNWNSVPGATGYKWNTVNDYASATEMGTVTTKTETGLVPNITYTRFVWAYKSCGVSTATTLSQALPFAVGQTYGGGIIFYLDGTGLHGLISATSDQSTNAIWGCYGTSISGTSTAIGTGQANTTAITNGCSTAGIAARICSDLALNGYNDWFLPSKDELYQMFVKKTVIGGFANVYYWSSSQYDNGYSWCQYFLVDVQHHDPKYSTYYVRAVRAF